MRHRKSGRKLGMDSSERKAMYRNMVTSLLLHGQITTTEPRAKELRRFAERVLSLGKRAPSATLLHVLQGDELQRAHATRLHAIRRARLWVNNDEALAKVFGEYAERFAARPGGYTRVIKARRRNGDNASMAVIQLVEALDSAARLAAPGDDAPQPDAERAEAKAAAVQADEEATEVTGKASDAAEVKDLAAPTAGSEAEPSDKS